MTNTKLHPSALFIILIMISIFGCQARSFIFDHPIPNIVVPTNTLPGEIIPAQPDPTPTSSKQKPAQKDGILTYQNPDYSFQFEYPVNWTLTENDHLVALSKGAIQLGINFRRLDEQDKIFRSGMGAGDINYIGKLNFLGQTIPIQALVFEGKTKTVFFSETGSIKAGNLVFMIALDDMENSYSDIELSSRVIEEAIQILSTFRHG